MNGTMNERIANTVSSKIEDSGFYSDVAYSDSLNDNSRPKVVACINKNWYVFVCVDYTSDFGSMDVTEESEELAEVRKHIRKSPSLHTTENDDMSEVYMIVNFNNYGEMYVVPYSVTEIKSRIRDRFEKLEDWIQNKVQQRQ